MLFRRVNWESMLFLRSPKTAHSPFLSGLSSLTYWAWDTHISTSSHVTRDISHGENWLSLPHRHYYSLSYKWVKGRRSALELAIDRPIRKDNFLLPGGVWNRFEMQALFPWKHWEGTHPCKTTDHPQSQSKQTLPIASPVSHHVFFFFSGQLLGSNFMVNHSFLLCCSVICFVLGPLFLLPSSRLFPGLHNSMLKHIFSFFFTPFS